MQGKPDWTIINSTFRHFRNSAIIPSRKKLLWAAIKWS